MVALVARIVHGDARVSPRFRLLNRRASRNNGKNERGALSPNPEGVSDTSECPPQFPPAYVSRVTLAAVNLPSI